MFLVLYESETLTVPKQISIAWRRLSFFKNHTAKIRWKEHKMNQKVVEIVNEGLTLLATLQEDKDMIGHVL